jgi:molecular chaperone GrpE
VSSDRRSEHDEQEPVVIRDNRKIDRQPGSAESASPTGGAEAPPAGAVDELDLLELDAPGPDANMLLLEERTRDLQRLQAEYANYRKRAERDRLLAGDAAVGRVVADLLPVIDDLERAKAHGDLAGPLKAVSDKLDAVFGKLGVVAFGEVGDPFDPAIHEAVLHDESDAVSVPTCTTVMRPGFRHNERLLRPAMVGVSDPAHPVEAVADSVEQPAENEVRDGQPEV